MDDKLYQETRYYSLVSHPVSKMEMIMKAMDAIDRFADRYDIDLDRICDVDCTGN